MKNRNLPFSVTGGNSNPLFKGLRRDNPNSKQSIQWNQSIVRQNFEKHHIIIFRLYSNYDNKFFGSSEDNLYQKITLEQKNEYKRTLQGLLEFAGERNWDGENADPVTAETVEAALTVVEELPSAVVPPELAADPEGNIEFDWHLDNGTMFTISVGPIGDVAISGLYLGKARLTGMEEDSEGNPLTLLRCGLEWLIEMQRR